MATNIGKKNYDHCRIGSLESIQQCIPLLPNDHCRIGSLENRNTPKQPPEADHCRIGSLENIKSAYVQAYY